MGAEGGALTGISAAHVLGVNANAAAIPIDKYRMGPSILKLRCDGQSWPMIVAIDLDKMFGVILRIQPGKHIKVGVKAIA